MYLVTWSFLGGFVAMEFHHRALLVTGMLSQSSLKFCGSFFPQEELAALETDPLDRQGPAGGPQLTDSPCPDPANRRHPSKQ